MIIKKLFIIFVKVHYLYQIPNFLRNISDQYIENNDKILPNVLDKINYSQIININKTFLQPYNSIINIEVKYKVYRN